MAMAQPADSTRVNMSQPVSLDDPQLMFALIRNFFLTSGVVTTQLIVEHLYRYAWAVPGRSERFRNTLRKIATKKNGEEGDTTTWELKHEWRDRPLPPAPLLSPSEYPMINPQHLLRILRTPGTSTGVSTRSSSARQHFERKQVQPKITFTSVSPQKLHPRILRSTFLERVAELCESSAHRAWYKGLEALLNDRHKLASINPDQVPVIGWTYTDRLVSIIAQKSLDASINRFSHIPDELVSSIHPLLRRSRWLDLSDQQWHQLQPVLRLASMFLSTPNCWEWYEHVATGTVKQDQNGRGFIDPPAETPTKKQKHHAVERVLSKIAESTTFAYADLSHHKSTIRSPGSVVNASAIMNCTNLYDPRPPRIVLNQDTLETLARYGNSCLSRGDYLNLVFCHAKTILHEIAHVFYYTAHRFASRIPGEPSFCRDGPLSRMREMGKSWEQVTFGHTFVPHWPNSGSQQPLTLIEVSLEDLSHLYPGMVDVGSADIHDLCKHVLPATWARKWFLQNTWDKIAEGGLGFIRDEASSYSIRHKKDYPIPGWCITYNTTSYEEPVYAVAWPYATVYTENGARGICFEVPHSDFVDELGYTPKEKEFALAWEAVYGKLNVKALLTDREVCTKREKRKREDDTDLPDEATRKKHKPEAPEKLFMSTWLRSLETLSVDPLLGDCRVGASNKVFLKAFGQLDVEALAAEFAEYCEEEASKNAFLKAFGNLSVDELLPDDKVATSSGKIHEDDPLSTCDRILDRVEKRLIARGYFNGLVGGCVKSAHKNLDEGSLIMYSI
jgi:hypothetical protein